MLNTSARAAFGRRRRQGMADSRKMAYTAAFGIGLIAAGSIVYSLSRRRYFSIHVAPLRADSRAGFQGNGGSDVKIKDRKNQQSSKPEKKSAFGFMPDWNAMGDRIRSAVVPDWAQALPAYVEKLQRELSMEPGTLAEDIWQSAHNADTHPEITRPATVRVSNELCDEEAEFLKKRKQLTRKALAKYLDLDEKDVHPDDVPTIAMCGSGGGLRALVAGSSSYLSAQEHGLFDCVTYTAGVSGSCWLQTLYYSSLTGQRHDGIIRHLKDRIHTHIAFPPPLMKLLTSAPTNKFLLSGGFEKYYGYKDADFGLVDVYGVLLGARLLVPRGDLDVDPANLKLSNQQRYIEDGEHPLPIYTAVRHELPLGEDPKTATESEKEKAKQEAWFQWFESTPYEVFCEEFGLGIPTWSLGRVFKGGKSVIHENGHEGLPETRIPLLMGIWGSAFCATLSHYYNEIRPLVKGLTGFGGLDEMIRERDDDLVKLHPIEPASMPNFAYGMEGQLPETTPESIYKREDLQLMDAGMSNNLPIYPLLRPGRNVDIIIAFDASADVKDDNWLRVVDGYARQRGIRSWPIGTGWPSSDEVGDSQMGKAMDEADETTTREANAKISQAARDQNEAEQSKDETGKSTNSKSTANESSKNEAQNSEAAKTESTKSESAKKEDQKNEPTKDQSKQDESQKKSELGYCNIWVGTTEERTDSTEPPASKQVESDWELMKPEAGIAVIYFPFMSNPKVEGVDPQTTEFMSTWNFIYTPENIDKVVALARANFEEGAERTRRTVRAVYERKKKQRLQKEEDSKTHRLSEWWKPSGK